MGNSSSKSENDSTAVPAQRQASALDSVRIQRGLLVLALLYTLYFAQTLLIPIAVTLLIALLLSPLVSLFKRGHIPRPISAALLVAVLVGPFSLLVVELAEPAQKWARLLPELSVQMSEQINSISDRIKNGPQEQVTEKEQESGFSFSRISRFFSDDDDPVATPQTDNAVTQRIKQGGLEALLSMLSAAPVMLAQLVTGLILILFLLVFGPDLFDAFIKTMPKRSDQQRAAAFVSAIQKELSRYIITASVINAGLGLSTAAALWLMGVEDALLWGVLVGLLNFAPYVGSLIGITILGVAGLAQYGMELTALFPAAVYLLLNLIESQFITPTVLGHNMRLNPLIIMVWLLIWGWLWGAIGVLLAVPLLVCIKLIAGQLEVWSRWVKIIETRA